MQELLKSKLFLLICTGVPEEKRNEWGLQIPSWQISGTKESDMRSLNSECVGLSHDCSLYGIAIRARVSHESDLVPEMHFWAPLKSIRRPL